MKLVVLSSGSKGNTTYIEYHGYKILIDIGNSCKYVVDSLKGIGIDAVDIDAILITHTHVDHVKGLKVFSKKFHPMVYLTKPMLEEIDCVVDYQFIDENCFKIGDFLIEVIQTSHDVASSVGYVVHGGKRSIVYITDTGYINKKYTDILSNKDIYVMESNHDVEMLHNGPYPFSLRQRILGDKGHLSNYDSAKYLSNFIGDRTKYVVLAHLSEDNNTPIIAYDTLKRRLDENGQEVPYILIAKQNEVLEEIIV